MSSHHNSKILKLSTNQHCYAWELCENCFREIRDVTFTSPEFGTEDNNNCVWYFKLIKIVDQSGYYLNLHLYLKNHESPDDNFNETLPVELGFLDKDHIKFIKMKSVKYDRNKKCFFQQYLIDYSAKDHESCLAIVCRIHNLQNFEDLLKNEKSSDIAIITKEKKFYVHRKILESRSAVFLAKIEKNKNDKNEINMTDYNPNIIEEVLRFIYTRKIKNHDIAADILVAAELYSIENLKGVCLEILGNNLKVRDVIDIFGVASYYRDNNLKKKAIKFIAAHADQIIEALE